MEVNKRNIALIQGDPDLVTDFIDKVRDHYNIYLFENGIKFYDWARKGGKVDAVVSAGSLYSPSGIPLLKQLKENKSYRKTPFIILKDKLDYNLKLRLVKERVSEVFEKKFDKEEFLFRTKWLIENPIPEEEKQVKDEHIRYHIPLAKRVFDIAVASIAILLLSPLLLLVALIIKLESKGPIFYTAKRVGTGYQIFDFYKFRSMKVGADAQLKNISHLNQYKNKKQEADAENEDPKKKEEQLVSQVKETEDNKSSSSLNLSSYMEQQFETSLEGRNSSLCLECASKGDTCQSALYLNGEALCEKVYLEEKKTKDEGKFIKISNDPRVTKIGKFIRNTSIDELPQLINVLKGDMSIVGNRPLPLYEAEKITVDAFNLRFMAPAGITGLWQVTKRGTSEMSEEERMQLDNQYATNYSLYGDVRIILRTIPALLQKENV